MIEHGHPPRDPWFDRFTNDQLPKLAQIGVRTVYLAAPWESEAEKPKDHRFPPTRIGDDPPTMEEIGSPHAPWDITVSPALGGEAGLKRLIDRAHELGMRVTLWCGPAHLSLSSPTMQQHPEWPIWRSNGTPDDQDYADLVGLSLAKGFGRYELQRYQKLHGQTGFDGLLLDSYLTFGMSVDVAQPSPHPQLNELMELERQLWAAGLREVHIEGVGVQSGGWAAVDTRRPTIWAGRIRTNSRNTAGSGDGSIGCIASSLTHFSNRTAISVLWPPAESFAFST